MSSPIIKPVLRYFIIFLYLFVVLGMTFTPMRIIPIFKNIFVVYGVGVFVSILAIPKYFRTKYFLMFGIYALILLSNYYFETLINLGNVLSESYIIIVTTCLAYYVITSKESRRLSSVLIWVFLGITLVYTVRTLHYSRSMRDIMRAAAMAYNAEIYEPFFLRGLAPFHFPHGITCLIPAYVLGMKTKSNKMWIRVVSGIMLFASVLLVYITQATGALIVAIFAMVLAIIAKRGRNIKNTRTLVIISLVFLPIVLSTGIQSAVLDLAGEIVGHQSSYYTKIAELKFNLASSLEVDTGGDIRTREELLGQTLDAIKRNPLIGVSDGSYGNHNALLDRWAEYGLIGFLPLFLGMIMFFNLVRKHLSFSAGYFYIIGFAANILMMLTKSMFGWHQWFCSMVMLPLLIDYLGGNPSFTNNINGKN